MTTQTSVVIKVNNAEAVLDYQRNLAFLPAESSQIEAAKSGNTVEITDATGQAVATATIIRTKPVVISSTSMTADGRQVIAGRAPRDYDGHEYDLDYAQATGSDDYMDMVDLLALEIGVDDTFNIQWPMLALWWDTDTLEPQN